MPETLLLRCSSCGAMNRAPADKMAQGRQPVCGQCKQPLSLSREPLTVTDANFASAVEASPMPVLLDLWAPWCGPCRMMAPVIEQLASEMAGRALVAKLNVDDNPVVASRFNIRSIPALLILKNGSEIDRLVGVQPKHEIARRLERALA